MTTAGWFVTGTDTGIGKSLITAALILGLRQSGLRVAGMKPIASGCMQTPNGLRSDDAVLLARVASVAAPYDRVNPVAFAPAIAPHLAAMRCGQDIDLGTILRAWEWLRERSDCVVVEGVGGWRVPLGRGSTLVELVRLLATPVILVVGIRLGCINHALLSAEAIARDGIASAGWVANLMAGPVAEAAEIVAALAEIIGPPLAVVPALEPPTPAAALAAIRPAIERLAAAAAMVKSGGG
jgi:dethiobiotin synthetase